MNLETLNKAELISHTAELIDTLDQRVERLKAQRTSILLMSAVFITLYML